VKLKRTYHSQNRPAGKKTEKAKTTLKKNNKVEDPKLLDFKTYYKATVTKTVLLISIKTMISGTDWRI
jgi:hypothetical protein